MRCIPLSLQAPIIAPVGTSVYGGVFAANRAAKQRRELAKPVEMPDSSIDFPDLPGIQGRVL